MMSLADPVLRPEAVPSPPSKLACPRCRKLLHFSAEDLWRCEGGHAYPVIDGIPDLTPTAGSTSSEIVLTPAVNLTVLLLTWNEAQNLAGLLPRLKALLERLGVRHELLVIDAGSTDGTAKVAASHGARVIRQSQPGYGAALREGFAHARGRFIATLDADLSHDPESLERLWNARDDAAVVIGSRYADGGSADMPFYRLFLSRVLNRIYALGLAVPYRDMSAAYRLYRREALKGIRPEGRNFDVLEDILMRLTSAGHNVVEVPIRHRRRVSGRSHVQLPQFAMSYARTLWRLWAIRHSSQAADHEERAYHSINPFRRWAERQRCAVLAGLARDVQNTLYVGCGSSPLLRLLPEATGVDLHLNKLRRARHLGRPLFRASPTALPFQDGSFGVVVWADRAKHPLERERQLDESLRVLAPGGRLVVETSHLRSGHLLKAFTQRALRLESSQHLFPSEFLVAVRESPPSDFTAAATCRPTAAAPLGLGVADITALQRHYVNDVLRKNRLSYGEYTRRFEREFARLHDRRYAIFCNSGTSALQVAVHALKELYGWRDGDEVLVPAVTFVATSNVVLQNRLRPVFVDVEPDHFGIDPAQLERHLSARTRALIPVHLFGQPCDMDPILEFASRNNLRVLEDSCETMFVRYKGRPTGSWGEAACFSSYVAHLIVTGVGGFAVTNDKSLATLMKSLMNHGRDHIYLSIDDDDTTDTEQLRQIVSRRFSFVQVGYSYRATEMEAALGVGELARHEQILRGRQANARYLSESLRDLEEFLQLPGQRKDAEHAYMMYPLVTRGAVDREDLLLHLEKAGIETRYLMPLINQPIYRKLYGDLEPRYPVAARLNRNGFAIGCHQGLGRADLDYVSDVFHAYFGRS